MTGAKKKNNDCVKPKALKNNNISKIFGINNDCVKPKALKNNNKIFGWLFAA